MTRQQRDRVRAAMVIIEDVRSAAQDRRLSPIGVEKTMVDVNQILVAAMCNLPIAEVDPTTYNAEIAVARSITKSKARRGVPA